MLRKNKEYCHNLCKSISDKCRFLLVTIVILISFLFVACQEPDRPFTGCVIGRVRFLNCDDHSGVVITLVCENSSELDSKTNQSSCIVSITTSLVDGSYEFTNVKPGFYSIHAYYADSIEKKVSLGVVVGEGVSSVDDLNLTATGSISGIISIDEKDSGNSGFLVSIPNSSYVSMTDDCGFFCITGIPGGSESHVLISKGSFVNDYPINYSIVAKDDTDLGRIVISSSDLESIIPSMVWKGELNSAPEHPQRNWAYYDTRDGSSYYFTGEFWDYLVEHVHSFSSEWNYNEEYHWHESICDHEIISCYDAHKWTIDESLDCSCTSSGFTCYSCYCGATKREDYSSLGHLYYPKYTDNHGDTTYQCIRCGNIITAENIPSPIFAEQPMSMIIASPGEVVLLSCNVESDMHYNIEYKWYESLDGTTKTGRLISNAEEEVLTLSAFSEQGIYNYYCGVTSFFIDSDGDRWESEESFSDVISVVYSGLPTVYVDTPNSMQVVSKEVWMKDATVSVIGLDCNPLIISTSIKGRGNSTWDCPKKSYSLKLDKKISFGEMPSHKRWVLVSNFFDKSLLRNLFASYLGENVFDKLAWTPSFIPVDLVFNGEIKGSYILGEQIKIGANRVDISKKDSGFIIEINERMDSDYNYRTDLGVAISLKDYDDENYSADEFGETIVKPVIENLERVLFSESYMNEKDGYSSVIDIDSFIDWYLLNEIAKNVDSKSFSSIYLYYDPADRLLHMGPIWDFDIGFGNLNYDSCDDYTGFWVFDGKWFSRLLTDPSFRKKVKDRFDEVKASVYETINTWTQKQSELLSISARLNFTIWDTLGSFVAVDPDGYEERTTYQSEVDYFIEWTNNRLEWLSEEMASW